MSRLLQTAFAVLAALLFSGCASKPKAPPGPTAFQIARPASLLVLAPINDTPDVLATPSVLAQLTTPLAEAGYYVLPVALVDETLKQNGVLTAVDAHQIAGTRLREIFGADAVLFVAVKRYGAVYKVLSSETTVALEAKLVDLRSGQLLWEGRSSASTAEQGNNGGGGLVGALVGAVIDQIASSLNNRSHAVAGIATQRLLLPGRPNGFVYGPRSPRALQLEGEAPPPR